MSFDCSDVIWQSRRTEMVRCIRERWTGWLWSRQTRQGCEHDDCQTGRIPLNQNCLVFFCLSKLVIIFILKKSILNHTLLVWTLNNTVHCIKLDSTVYFWTSMCWRAIRPLASINPLHLNIKMHILHTVLFIYCKVLTRRICVTKKWNGDHCLYCSDLNVCFRGDIVRRN